MDASFTLLSAALLMTAFAVLQMLQQGETALATTDVDRVDSLRAPIESSRDREASETDQQVRTPSKAELVAELHLAPIESAGDNVYIVWFTDRSTHNTNSDVIFRASNDGGATFGDKINLSNTTDTDSINPEIETVADKTVIVTWWERANETSNEPVMRISNDNGLTFGSLLKLTTNGTIDSNSDGGTISSSRLSEEIS
jgi:hypothetical protein